MDLEKQFPLRLLINLGRREDRRFASEAMLRRHGIEAERFPAVDQRRVRSARGYQNAGRYALALTQRLAIRRAKHQGATSVLLFEDDVVLHESFRDALRDIRLPDDWGIFYFGCAHTSRPLAVAPGLVRCEFALDTHAIAINAPYYDRVMAALAGNPAEDEGGLPASDWRLAELHQEIPAYAAFPNLAWQAASDSDLLRRHCTNYDPAGAQRHSHYATRGLGAELLGGSIFPLPPEPGPTPLEPPPPASVNPAFLFLTVGDHHQPLMWADYLSEAGESCGVYCHAKHPDHVTTPFLKDALIDEFCETSWGHVSLVKATLALLRAALADSRRHSHFVLLSESCVPAKPFHHLVRTLQCDPRSIVWNCTREEVAASQPKKGARFVGIYRIPPECARFQSQWMLLSREAAELVTQDDFTSEFASSFAPDECYFMTVLAMKGYPVEERVRPVDCTWNRWAAGAGHPIAFSEVDGAFAAELLASPSLFARKFTAESNIRGFGIHVGHDWPANLSPSATT